MVRGHVASLHFLCSLGAGCWVNAVFWCLPCNVFLSPMAEPFWHCQVCPLMQCGGRALGNVPPASAIVLLGIPSWSLGRWGAELGLA